MVFLKCKTKICQTLHGLDLWRLQWRGPCTSFRLHEPM